MLNMFQKPKSNNIIYNEKENLFLEEYRKIKEYYHLEKKEKAFNIDYLIYIKNILYYLYKLYYLYLEINSKAERGIDNEIPNKDINKKIFLNIEVFGGKNKSEYINYKYEGKVYKRKIRYEGKKKYIIINKLKIFIKK